MELPNPKIFFSYATVAQLGEPAYKAAMEFLQEFYQIGPPEVLYKYDHYSQYLSEEAAKLLNCDPEEITTIKNTSEGINIASEALPLNSDDEVLVLGNEYPANLLPWLKKKKDGIRVTVINGDDNEQAFNSLVQSVNPSTKVISISSAQYYDGYMADLKQLSDICRQNEIFLVIDAVQSIGVRKFDLRATPVDFLVCGGQKYLQAGMGSGIMYVNKNTISQLRDTKVGIRSMKEFTQDGYTLKDTAERFQDGTQNLAGIVALHAAIKHVNSIGIEYIEHENTKLLNEIKNCLNNYDIPFIDHGDHQSNIVSMRISNPQDLFEYLKHHSIYIRPTKDVARLSFIHESRIEDVEAMAKLTQEWIRRI